MEAFSLEELLDMRVITASKREERQSRSPAIVSVLTAEDIQRLGLDTLYDVLATVPGLEVVESFYGYSSLTVRGVLQTHYNDKTLLLLNGHPLYDTVNWSWYLEAIPVSAVQRIEVIRGPGSTLYGTNAYAGVINIITQETEERPLTRASVTAGSFKTADVSFSTRSDVGGLRFLVAGQHRDSDGYPFEVAYDEEGRSGTPAYPDDPLAYENDFDNAYVSVGWRGLRLSGLYFRNEKDKLGLVPMLVSTGERHLEGAAADVRYEAQLAEGLSLFAFGWYDTIRKRERIAWYPPASGLKERVDADGSPAPVGGPGDQEFQGHKLGAEVRADWQATGWLGVLGGLVYERTHAGSYVFRYVGDRPGSPSGVDPAASAFLEHFTYDDVAGYLQAQASPLETLGLVAGLRYSHNSSYGGFLAPRAGVVWQAAEPLSLKLLYGRAFRTPSFFEKYVHTVNVLYGGDVRRQEPDAPFALQEAYVLRPEAIDTVDLAAEGTWQRHAARITLFYLDTQDKIDRVRRAARVDASGNPMEQSPIPQYGNAEGYSVVGVEAEVRGQPWEGLSYFANAATRYAFQGSLSEKLPWRTPLTANLGLTWRLPAPLEALTLTTSVMAVGERAGPLSPERDVRLFPEETLVVPGYVLWNANASWALTEQVELSLLLHNLLDQDYGYPESIRARGPVVPGGPGFAAYGRLGVTL